MRLASFLIYANLYALVFLSPLHAQTPKPEKVASAGFLRSFIAHGVTHLEFSFDGKRLYTAQNSCESPQLGIYNIGYSLLLPDQQSLPHASSFGIWDVEKGKRIDELLMDKVHPRAQVKLAVTPTKIMGISGPASVHFWKSSPTLEYEKWHFRAWDIDKKQEYDRYFIDPKIGRLRSIFSNLLLGYAHVKDDVLVYDLKNKKLTKLRKYTGGLYFPMPSRESGVYVRAPGHLIELDMNSEKVKYRLRLPAEVAGYWHKLSAGGEYFANVHFEGDKRDQLVLTIYDLNSDKTICANREKRSYALFYEQLLGRIGEINTHELFKIAFSRSNQLVAMGDQTADKVKIVDMKSGSAKWQIQWFDGATLAALALSPDGKTLATAHMDSTVRLWDLTGKANTPLEFLKPIRAGKTGEKKTKSYFRGGIQRIDLEALAKGPMGSRVNEGISSLAWLSDGQFVTVQRGTSRIWDYKRKSPASSFRNRFLKHLSAPHIDFSQGNGLWSILADPGYGRFGGRLAHHDIGTGAELKVGNIDKDCEYPFTGLAIANKKSFALVGHAAHYLAIWNTQKMQEEHRFRGYPLGFYALAISADDRFALGCHGREIVLFDIEKKQEVRRMIGHGDLVKQTVFLRDGKRALSCSLDKTIRLWDIETGKEIRNYSFHTRGVTQVALFPDQSHFLSSGYDKRVCLWEIKGNQPKEVFGNILAERRIRISPNGLGVLFAGYGSNGRLNDGFGLYFADVAK